MGAGGLKGFLGEETYPLFSPAFLDNMISSHPCWTILVLVQIVDEPTRCGNVLGQFPISNPTLVQKVKIVFRYCRPRHYSSWCKR